ncbi:nucleotidyltransferase family protein [Chlorobium ferrooxidans]|uniref:Nucleotidyl transferase n=1 Tax=Chlorobium ferrooxidans DSM 13031 TaxID=377431 RepID=Q0YTW7_9CHLB|nr:nucleotidyltransferase family protein [Chlorobium ferrooxidans]EAT59785.1 Nucleotidyl transferase [Chlorobium ferrooxidans DSM 13031]
MRALLLAAGCGTRLRPLTNVMPKCLVPVKGKPLLEIWLDRLTRAGAGPFLVNTHYLAEQVERFVDASPFREQVTLVHEPELLGTAGTLVANLHFFQGREGMLIHADNYSLADLSAFMEAHRQRPEECVMTMMTFRTDRPSTCGIVELDGRGVVAGFYEKDPDFHGNLANGAVYILSSDFLEMIGRDLGSAKDFSTEVLGGLMGRIYTYETREVFLDVGTPEMYNRANTEA